MDAISLVFFKKNKLTLICQSARFKRSNTSVAEDDEDPETNGRVAGTVRRHIPLDTRDPPGAILHFYIGDSHDFNGYFRICNFLFFVVGGVGSCTFI